MTDPFASPADQPDDPSPQSLPRDRGDDVAVQGCLYVVIALVGVMVLSFLTMTTVRGVAAARLIATQEVTKARVTIDGIDLNRKLSEPSHYEFTVDGERFAGRGQPSDRAGEAIDVAYLPAEPSVNRPVGGLWLNVAAGLFALVVWVYHRIAPGASAAAVLAAASTIDRWGLEASASAGGPSRHTLPESWRTDDRP